MTKPIPKQVKEGPKKDYSGLPFPKPIKKPKKGKR